MSCRRRAAGEYNADVEADLSNAAEGVRECYEVRERERERDEKLLTNTH